MTLTRLRMNRFVPPERQVVPLGMRRYTRGVATRPELSPVTRRLLVIVAHAAILSACASSNKPASPSTGPQPVTTRIDRGTTSIGVTTVTEANERTLTLGYPVEKVWGVLPSVFGELEIPIGTMLPDRWQIGNPSYSARRRLGGVRMDRYFDCGGTSGMPNAETFTIHMTVMVQLIPRDADTQITTAIDATGKPMTAGSQAVHCSSTGALEERILASVGQKLREGK